MHFTGRLRAIVLALALVAGAGGTAVTAFSAAAPPAHAVTLNGLCEWDTNYSYCVRQTNGFFYYWPRDISGDANQQMSRSYQGQVSATACWPFTCGSGLNSLYNGSAVYKYFNINTGACLAASNLQFGDVHAQPCNSNGTNWVLPGNASKSFLVNVYFCNGDPQHRIWTLRYLDHVYDEMSVSPLAGSQWGLVPVIG